jgi:hypothetical protein
VDAFRSLWAAPWECRLLLRIRPWFLLRGPELWWFISYDFNNKVNNKNELTNDVNRWELHKSIRTIRESTCCWLSFGCAIECPVRVVFLNWFGCCCCRWSCMQQWNRSVDEWVMRLIDEGRNGYLLYTIYIYTRQISCKEVKRQILKLFFKTIFKIGGKIIFKHNFRESGQRSGGGVRARGRKRLKNQSKSRGI